MKQVKTYVVSFDPYENGDRAEFQVRAGNKREARRRARRKAEIEGFMRAAWRRVECVATLR